MASPPLWILERGAARVILFGVRPGATDKAWLTEKIEHELRESHEFWRETPPAEEIAASPRLAELGLSREIPLASRLDDETNARLASVATSVGLDTEALQPFRPWLAAQLLTPAMHTRAGFDPSLDVEDVLTALATELGKPVRFEFTVESVLDVLGTLTPSAEVERLQWVLDTVEKGAEHIKRSFAGWLSGDLTIDEADLVDMRSQYPSLYDVLIRDRNEAWIPRMDTMLSSPRSTFIAVGCAHLIGDGGIPVLAERLDGRVSRY